MSANDSLYQSFEGQKQKRLSDGRVLIYRPDHPRANSQGYVLRSHLVWESHHGRWLSAAFVIHHKNGDPSDDRIENLQAMLDQRHRELHSAERTRSATGRFKPEPRCKFCGSLIEWGKTTDDHWRPLRHDLMGFHKCIKLKSDFNLAVRDPSEDDLKLQSDCSLAIRDPSGEVI